MRDLSQSHQHDGHSYSHETFKRSGAWGLSTAIDLDEYS